MKEPLWCSFNNSAIEEIEGTLLYVPHSGPLVPCTKETCERWREGECIFLVKVENGRRGY
jgi:hypothetical protein